MTLELIQDNPIQAEEHFAPHIENATGIYVTVHGHFYQPPRENPYLDTIERQPSAHPFHDWNERIYHECYRPNAFARMFNDKGEIVGIVNNYEYLSFNIGATLMSWLQNYDIEVYQKIIEADRKSCDRLNGHGNAIAQVYNHIILPLANKRDKYTQIRWGKEDFQQRFGREPEGMWLAETAVDMETLEVLIAEGIRFIILAPSQAESCRLLPTPENPHPEWHEVGGGQIDPTRPYRCFVNEQDYIDIFFYDGPISRDMGFGELLGSSYVFASRLGQAIKGDHRPSQLLSVATDGETFGHHKKDTERCLAYAFTVEFPKRGWTVTNFAHYLSLHPPTWEVILKPATAWSCSHGVDRWQDDCGCGGGGEWHQKWRRPLRDTLDWLRDELITIYEETGRQYFLDPWAARNEYIQVVLDRSIPKVERFLAHHQRHYLSPAEQIEALRLLEMQRHALLMYTSCGWFFEELSRPEGVQILRYAARAIELAAEVAGVQLEQEFVFRLSLAPSNVETFGDGAEVYRQMVISAQVNFHQVAAHYAISSLFNNYQHQERLYCYDAQQLDYQKQQLGALTLAVGQVKLVSEITWESNHFVFAVLHLGGWDFHCCIQPFAGRNSYGKLKEQLFAALNQASMVQIILAMSQLFGDKFFGLQDLFAEERHRIMSQLTQSTKKGLDQLYTQVYRDNYGILLAFQRDELPVPQELQVAAEIAISHRCANAIETLANLVQNGEDTSQQLLELQAIASEANHLKCQLQIPEGKRTLEGLIFNCLWHLLYNQEPVTLEAQVHQLEGMIDVGKKLRLDLYLYRAQELYYHSFHTDILPNCLLRNNGHNTCIWDSNQVRLLLRIGVRLGVMVSMNYHK
jgi:alpha-amylase/alpha-mannosidase (GH57 family)